MIMPAPADDPVLDSRHLAALRALRGGDSGLRLAVAAFARQTPTLLTRIEQAVATGDRPQALRAAHTVRGSALTLGLPRLARVAGDLLAGRGDPDGTLDRLRAAAVEADAALARMLDDPGVA